MKEEIIELFKAKAEMRKLKKGIKTEEDLVNYLFGEDELKIKLREIDARERLKDSVLKNKNVIVKSVAAAVAVAMLSGSVFAGCRAMANGGEDKPLDTQETITQTEIITDGDYGHQLSQEEVLQIAEKALAKVEEEMVRKGVRPMGDPSGPYFPEWFNAEMLATIVLLESSNRVTEEDGSPLFGKPVDVDGKGTMQRARGLCQILPITLDYVNWWLKNVIKSDWSFTREDCDNPETALMICILINIANGNNYFSHWKSIYDELDFENYPNLQRDCIIASYHNGADAVSDAYYAGVLMNTYLNRNTSAGEYLKRFYNNKIECDKQR